MPALTEHRGKIFSKSTEVLLANRFDQTGRTWKMKNPKGPWITRENMTRAIEGSCGIVMRIARLLSVSHASVHGYLKRKGNEDMLELFRQEAAGIVDRAEQTVMDSMENGFDTRTAFNAARFVLDRKGRERGWTKPETGKQSISVTAALVDLTKVPLPLDMRKSLLAQIEAEGKEHIAIDAPPGSVSLLPAPAEEPIRISRRVPAEGLVVIRKRAS